MVTMMMGWLLQNEGWTKPNQTEAVKVVVVLKKESRENACPRTKEEKGAKCVRETEEREM